MYEKLSGYKNYRLFEDFDMVRGSKVNIHTDMYLHV